MLIAKINQDGSIVVGNYRTLFPNTSFTSNGPSNEWLTQNSCMPVNVFLPHDRETERLETCPPYIFGDWVYTVQVVPKSQEEIDRENKAKIPSVVTMRQGRLALLQFNLLDTVDTALANITDPMTRKASQIEWEYATEIRRDSPLVTQLSSSLGLTEEQMDQLFLLASTL